MARRFVLCGLSACALLCGATLAQAESVDEVSRLLTEKMRAVKSLSAKTHTTAEMSSPGYTDHRTSEGLLELVRKDGKVFLRTESRETSTTEAGGQVSKQEGVSLAIMDGTGYVYSYIEGGDQKTAYKTKSQVDWDANPIEGAKAAYDIELLPDDTIDGAAVYVFKLTPKPGSGAEGSATECFRKDCGYPVKIVHFDAAGKPVMTATYTELKIDQEISPDRFVFNPPEGVEVVDLTQMMCAPATAPAAEEAAPAPESAPQTAPAPAPPQTESGPATSPAEAGSQPAQPPKAAEKVTKTDTKKTPAKKGGKKGKQRPKP
jgi:outer membrane lipoprotein-sorting protein